MIQQCGLGWSEVEWGCVGVRWSEVEWGWVGKVCERSESGVQGRLQCMQCIRVSIMLCSVDGLLYHRSNPTLLQANRARWDGVRWIGDGLEKVCERSESEVVV